MSSPKSKALKLDPTSAKKLRLVWVDCEMTGLDVETQHLVEIACIITEGDTDLTLVAESENVVIHQSEEILSNMTDWCKDTFAKNGLTESIRKSEISLCEAEERLVKMIKKHAPCGSCPLAGNTVSMDRRFLEKYMPEFAGHLHYRTVDVSSVKELCKRWNPQLFKKLPKKNNSHRALDDIKESIEELRFFQKHFFVSQ